MESFDAIVAAAQHRFEEDRAVSAVAQAEAVREAGHARSNVERQQSLAHEVGREVAAITARLRAQGSHGAEIGVLSDTHYDLRRRSMPRISMNEKIHGQANDRAAQRRTRRSDAKLERLLQPHLKPVWQTFAAYIEYGTDDWHNDVTHEFYVGPQTDIYTSSVRSDSLVLLQARSIEQLDVVRLGTLRQGLGNLVVRHGLSL